MQQSVADNEVIDVQQHVVSRYLVEHPLGQGYCRRLVFDYHYRSRCLVVKHAVAAELLVAGTKFNLVGEQGRRITLVADKEVDEMLAHPFLGRQADVFPPQSIENVRLVAAARDFYFVLW